MSYFYFFKKDGECKWMRDQSTNVYPKYIRDPIEYNGEYIKFYGILNWIYRHNKGVNLDWVNNLSFNYVNTINDLPEGAGVYITGYDADLDDVKTLKKRGVPIIENPCPWIKQLRNQLLEVNTKTHQIILMIIKGHMVYDCYKSAFPDDIIIIEPENFIEEINKNKNKKPIHLLVYAAFREKDAKNVIDFINKNYYHPDNNLDGYKKTICMWSKQGLFEEIKMKVKEYNLDEIWIICSNKGDTSTKSIIRETIENEAIPIIIIKEEDIPKKIDPNLRAGVLLAGVPLSEKVRNFKNFINEKFNTLNN